jgi:carbonic anhydrase
MLHWLAVAYKLLPFQLIPDFTPVVGHLDDLVIVPALVVMALKLLPTDVCEECRALATHVGTRT